MSNAAKLKKKAIELEQKKQFDKALSLYIQFLQESDGSIDDADISLYNRVGDLLLRTGNSSDALNYFEKAVELYAERGFHNNAIALCNRVLRQAPGRASIYYKLGKISATKGFKSDAKKNFLEYADRMQKVGQIDEAFRALKEFADLCPDQDDIRLLLAEQLTKENRQDEALEQLQKLHDKLDSEGRTAEVRATVDRMKSIDPEAVPQTSGSYRPQKSSDLIFLDTSNADGSRPPKAAPKAVPAPAAPTPPGRQVSDPDLVVLTLGDQPDAAVPPAQSPAVADGLEPDEPNERTAGGAIPFLRVADERRVDEEAAGGFEVAALSPTAQDAPAKPLGFQPTAEPAAADAGVDAAAFDLAEPTDGSRGRDRRATPLELTAEPSGYVAGPSLAVDYGDLAADLTPALEPDGGDLFDFRSPPRSDGDIMDAGPAVSLDPDVAFPSFDLAEMALPSADEVTSGASLAAALGLEATLAAELENMDAPVDATTSDMALAATERDSALDQPSSDFAGSREIPWVSAEPTPAASHDSVTPTPGANIDDLIVAVAETQAAAAPVADAESPPDALVDVSIDDLIEPPPSAARVTPEASRTMRPSSPTGDFELVTPRSVEPPKPPERDVAPAREPASEHLAEWESQRSQAERLLEAGDRVSGVQLLERMAAELDRMGDLERALTIVDELIRLSPDSVRHRQKRVELAFRANDRAKLIDAYLELGDALFRSGEERKARAVYQRVLELAPEDVRAQAAVESVSSMSPPQGSGAIAAISDTAAPIDVRQPPLRPPPRDLHHAAPTHAAANGTRTSNGISAPAQPHKPSPLDRSAATNGEFVDLGEWLRKGANPKSTRMIAEEKPPTGDEQADFQEMLKRFKQGVAENVDDEDYESHYDLGVAYKEMGLIEEAVAEFQKALRGHSNRVRAYEALGQCFVEKDQYQVAASVLSRAIAIGDGDDHHLVGVLYLLGRATEALGRDRDALDYYQRVFAVDIEFRDVADRIRAIERKAT